MGNPFTLTFGKKSEEYIIRHQNAREITSAFASFIYNSFEFGIFKRKEGYI